MPRVVRLQHQRLAQRLTHEWGELMRDYRWLCNNKILQGIQIRMNSPLKGKGHIVCQPISELCVARWLLLHDELILSICRCRPINVGVHKNLWI